MRIFRSSRFNVFLLIAIAGASALGTLLPQAGDAPERVDLWIASHPALGRLFQGLGFFDLFGSRWFMALLGLMALDIVLCNLARAPSDPAASDGEAASKGLRAQFAVQGPVEEAAGRASAALAEAGYHVCLAPAAQAAAVPGTLREPGTEGKRPLWVATRHRAQRWGATLAHAALVAILAGGLAKRLFGFVEMVPVIEGGFGVMQSKPGWELRVGRFDVEFYDRGQTPKLFASELKVFEGDRELGAKVIKVNDPLDIRGVRFYQASWGTAGIRSATLEMGGRTFAVRPQTPTRLSGTRIVVAADAFLPSFSAGADGRPDSPSAEPGNPAVRFRFQTGGRPSRPLWLPLDEPGGAYYEEEDGTLQAAPAPPFRLAAVEPAYFSGIQVAYDPGFKLVLLGGAGWLAGLLLLFQLHRRRVWLSFEPGGEGGVRARLAGWSSRGDREYKREFEALARRLQGMENGWS